MEEEMPTEIRDQLKAPRACAIAGIVFSILLIISLVFLGVSVPAIPGDSGTWLSGSEKSIRLALGLLPFAGIAFLWFMGSTLEANDRFAVAIGNLMSGYGAGSRARLAGIERPLGEIATNLRATEIINPVRISCRCFLIGALIAERSSPQIGPGMSALRRESCGGMQKR